MKKYDEAHNRLVEIRCNRCGREIAMKGDIPQEDLFQVEKSWGYFSEKDGKKHSWDLCEECYEQLTGSFQIPLEETDMTEFL